MSMLQELSEPQSDTRVCVLQNATETEFDDAARTLTLHPLLAEHLRVDGQEPRFESFGGVLSLSLWDATDDRSRHRGDDPRLTLVFDHSLLLVVQNGHPDAARDASGALADGISSPSDGAYRLLRAVVDDFIAARADIESALDDIETEAFDAAASADYRRFYRLRRRIERSDRAVSALAAAMRAAESSFDLLMAGDQDLRDRYSYLERTVRGLARSARTTLDAAWFFHLGWLSGRQQTLRSVGDP